MVNDGLKKGKRRERGGNVHVDPAFPFEDGKEPVSLYFPDFGLKTQTRPWTGILRLDDQSSSSSSLFFPFVTHCDISISLVSSLIFPPFFSSQDVTGVIDIDNAVNANCTSNADDGSASCECECDG